MVNLTGKVWRLGYVSTAYRCIFLRSFFSVSWHESGRGRPTADEQTSKLKFRPIKQPRFRSWGVIELLCGFQDRRCMRDFTTNVCTGKPREHHLSNYSYFPLYQHVWLCSDNRPPTQKNADVQNMTELSVAISNFFDICFLKRSLHSEMNRLECRGLRWLEVVKFLAC